MSLTIVTAREILPDAERALTRHGCIIMQGDTHSEVTFPEGTTRTELFPRMPQGERYMLTLPDGYVVRQIWLRLLEQHVLYYSID